MKNMVIISSDSADKTLGLLKKVLEDRNILDLEATREQIDLTDIINRAFPSDLADVDVPEITAYEDEELVDDEDLRLIVQVRVDNNETLNSLSPIEQWADTNIPEDSLDDYRKEFPTHEYRLVAVYDEIVEELDSVDQDAYISVEDEIGFLKAEVLQLKALVAQYEQGDNAQ